MSQSKSFLRLRWFVLSLFAIGTLLIPLAGTAQGASSFVLTSAVRQCDESIVDLVWSAQGTIASLTISVSNTSSGWSDQTVLTAPVSGNSYSYAFDHHAIDKVVVKAVIDGQFPTVYQYTADVGACGAPGAIGGGQIGDDTNHPDIRITIENATCSGFNWSVESPFEVRVYVSVMDTIGHGMIPFVPQNGTNVTGTETYVVDSEDRTFFGILITVYDIDTDQELARQSLGKNCPIASDPTETPTETPTKTPDSDEETRVVIQINLPGGESITGAPYSVFAPIASQFAAEPYLQGVVGPDNTIVLIGLMQGQYRLLIEPENMDPIDVVFSVGSEQVTELVIQLDADGTVVIVPRQPVPNPTSTPTDGSTSGSGKAPAQSVDTLPSTGAGGMQAASPVLALSLMAAVLGMAGLLVHRRFDMNR